VFGLLAPNGAGKTTVIKMLTTLLPPTSGKAEIAGFDLSRHPADVLRVIGYVPQLLSADDALAFMDLGQAANRLVRTCSGGMIQRLEIAQSMLHRPEVLFLEESAVGLDPTARRAVWDLVLQLRSTYGTTAFLTTHYMDEADPCAINSRSCISGK